ncbi:MAG: 30S ribosomal protein S6--L-glutamate ligase [Firmicutes bacterium]|nr:30S ribosomal protein S6--L-glutamate ligase [Bacillota bacterium]
MNAKGYIIEKYNNMNNAYTSRRYIEEGTKKGINFEIIGAYDTIDTGDRLINRGKVLEKAAFVINRHKYGNIKDKLAALGEVSVNSVEVINEYVDKSRQRGLVSPCMTAPLSLLAYSGTPFERIEAAVGLPFIAKGLCGSQGNMVYLIENTAQYSELCQKYKDTELLFQEYISTSCGRDVRMLSVRGEVTGCMQRTAKSGFKANFALGADVCGYPVDNDIKRIAADIYEQTKADVLGIDLLFGKDGYVFCEINVTPGIEGIEKATGCNAAAAVTALGGLCNEH